jgi:glycosyltransferase involved in cell wall biosynthesis
MIDVIIQTFNEELNLPHTLESLRGWDVNVFIVDSGSTDRTAEIGRAFGATVVHHAWEGYAAQKNWAIDNLPFTSSWILILDADEAVSPELRDEITQLLSKPPEEIPESAFYLNRVFIFMGQKILHCGYFPSWNLRLFKRGHARYEQRLVHEHMIVTGKTGYSRNLLIHEDRRGLEHFIAKHNRYSTLEATEMYNAKTNWPGWWEFYTDRNTRRRYIKNVLLPRIPFPWAVRFIYMYILQLGFLDGVAGYRLCTFISSYELMIRMKYGEIQLLRGQAAPVVKGLSIAEGITAQTPAPPSARTTDSQPATKANTPPPGDAPATPTPPQNVPPPVALPKVSTPATSTAHVIASRGDYPRDPSRAPVSVLITTKNSGDSIARCLDHLRWADEIIVLDSSSTDNTVAIATRYGATVVNFQWSGTWPKKKNWALTSLPFRNDWVLILDPEEWVTPELADEISRTLKPDAPTQAAADGYYINRRFIFMGAWIKRCGYYPSWTLSLLRRGKGLYEQPSGVHDASAGDTEVHEHIACTGTVAYLKHDMLNFAFPSISVFVEKYNRLSSWSASLQFSGTQPPITANETPAQRRLKSFSRGLPFRPTLRFLYSYIWQRGFLDGKPGLVFCRLLAIYEYLSASKYYEMKRADEDTRKARSLSSVPPAVLPNEHAKDHSSKEARP